MDKDTIRSATGRTLDELNMENVLNGTLTTQDLSISAEMLHHQADKAQQAGYVELAENLRRAAELTMLSNEKIFQVYGALRPGRASCTQLQELANELENEYKASRTAALIREAAEAYLRRGIIQKE